MADVFVSYAREDEARVRTLVHALESTGHTVFWDRRTPAGRSWREHIGSALERARCVLAVWSRHSIESSFVAEEADAGRQRGVLLPVMLDAVLPPLGFRSVHAADLSTWEGDLTAPAWRQLVVDLESILIDPQLPPPKVEAARSAGHEGAAHTQVITNRTALSRRLTLFAVAFGLLAVGSLGGLVWTSLHGPDISPATGPPEVSAPSPPEASSPGSAATQNSVGQVPFVLRVLEAWSNDNATLSLRIEVSNAGASAATFDAARLLQLQVSGLAPLSPEDSRPLFDTLQPGQSEVFELRFAVTPRSGPTLSLLNTSGRPVGSPLPLPALR
jgi:hypothetical protein